MQAHVTLPPPNTDLCHWALYYAGLGWPVHITKGAEVLVVLKRDQRTGKLTRGVVKDILTRSENHPHGIKVRLTDGKIGRVQEIITQEAAGLEAEKTAGKKSPT